MAKNTPTPAAAEAAAAVSAAEAAAAEAAAAEAAAAEAAAAEAAAAEAALPAGPTVEGLALVDIPHINAKCGEWVTVDAEVAKHLHAAGALDVNAPKPEPEFL